MRAAICREFGQDLTIENVSLAPPEAGEVTVKIAACAICHSDITYADGRWGGSLPAVFGHEATGVITQTGPGATYRAGDRVAVTLIKSCGTCPACAGGMPTSCDDKWKAGNSPITDASGAAVIRGMNCGAFAEYAVVDESQLAHLPDDIPLDVASLLSCGVITGFGAVVNTAELRPGQTAAVIGAGGVGLNAIQACAIAGARAIIAIDIAEEKLDVAREYGATNGVLATDPALVEKVRALTGGRGVDFAFVAVGAPIAFENAPALLALGGAMVIVGMPGVEDVVGYKPVDLAGNNQRFLGSAMGQTVLPRDMPRLLEHYRNGRLKLDELISGRFTLDQINEAIAKTRAGIAGRNVLILDPTLT